MKKEKKPSVLERLATFIVDKRNGFLLIYVLISVFSIFSSNWVKVNNDITSYLSEETETRQGLDISNSEFLTFATASVMISNITFEDAQVLADEIAEIEGIYSVSFEENESYYKNASALLMLTFDTTESDQLTIDAMYKVREVIQPYDHYVKTTIGADSAAELEAEISNVLVIALIIIIVVLLFTSKTYIEILVLLLTFGIAALLNMGTNYFFGEISFISNSIAVILQLALAIDYAIILCHRFTEEREHFNAREAAIVALSKAIPEISSSSLTTISGLAALMFMQFKIGFDMGMVLIKALVVSIIVVFTLMPGLLMIFSKLMDKTKHKNFVPEISVIGKMALKTKVFVPPAFILLIIIAFSISGHTQYAFGATGGKTFRQNEQQIAEKKTIEKFGSANIMAVVVPSGDYEKEGLLLSAFENESNISEAIGLSNTEAKNGYMITDRLTAREFAELTDVDIEVAKLLYSAHAVKNETYGRLVNGLEDYGVPLNEIFMLLYEQVQEGYVNLEPDIMEDIESMHDNLVRGEAQLSSESYTRMLLITDLNEEGDKTFEYLDQVHRIIDQFYEESYIVGNSMSNYDLAVAFAFDNVVISILTALFVMLVLLFTFKSSGLPVLLVLTIQGSIWINFSFPPITDTSIYFLSYLVVTSLQMGATIDYAIVVTSRYMTLKRQMPIGEAMILSLNQAFPTVITSGSILVSSGLLIGYLSSDYSISGIGIALGRGTIISIILVLGVLPQTLLLGDYIIEKTAFVLKRSGLITSLKKVTAINGRFQGYINGYVDASINGKIRGDVDGRVIIGQSEELIDDKQED